MNEATAWQLPADWDGSYLKTVPTSTLRQWPLEAIKVIHLEMGMQCNVRCAMCFQTDFRPRTVLSERVWKEQLRPAYALARELILIGGEPTILPNCRTLLELAMCNYPHLALVTSTNGILFKGIWEDAFLQQGSYLNISLNSVRPDTYRRLVQFGRFEDAMANIDRMVRRKRETGSRLVIRLSAVVSNDTIDEIPEIVQWSADHGLDQVSLDPDFCGRLSMFRKAHVQERIAAAYEVAERNPQIQLLHLADVDRRFAMRAGVPSVRPHPLAIHAPVICSSGFDTIHIDVGGWVRPCCSTWFRYGNLLASRLQDVWQGPAAFQFRRRMLALDFRDCWTGCDRNVCPLRAEISRLRQGWTVFRRNPVKVWVKAARKFGLTTAQVRTRNKLLLS